jgi:hypothetical protein
VPTPTGTTPPTTSYYTVPPCRLLDTRNVPPALTANTDRIVMIGGVCGISPTAKALSFNITIIGPTAVGDLRIYPFGDALPAASVINFVAGQTRANNAILPLGLGRLAVHDDQVAGASVNFIIDVNGYFQ